MEKVLDLPIKISFMARIAGLTKIKNASGKVTHVTLSVKHHGKLLEDILDHNELVTARNDVFIPWEEAREELLSTAKRKSKSRV